MRLSSRIGLAVTLAAAAAVAAGTLAATGTFDHAAAPHIRLTAATLPVPSHIVIVMEENHSYADIIGNTANAPYMNHARRSEGALMTSSFAITHPSEPNYMALFGGSTFGLTADNCPVSEGNTANLGSELLAAGHTFKGYSEGLPSTGSTSCTSGDYARKHSPWINFSNVPAADSLPFSALPEPNYSSLPTLSFVIPNLNDDMHDGTIAAADTWLKNNISAYATWAQTQQQPADRHLGRGRLHREQPDPDDLRRPARDGRPVQRDDQPLQRAGHHREDVRPHRRRQQLRRQRDQRHLVLVRKRHHPGGDPPNPPEKTW